MVVEGQTVPSPAAAAPSTTPHPVAIIASLQQKHPLRLIEGGPPLVPPTPLPLEPLPLLLLLIPPLLLLVPLPRGFIGETVREGG